MADVTFKKIWSCGESNTPTSNDFVKGYKASNGYIIKGNASRHIFTSRIIPADFWYVYDKDGKEVFADHYLKKCKAFVEEQG